MVRRKDRRLATCFASLVILSSSLSLAMLGGDATTPSSSTSHAAIRIDGNDEFTTENGVLSGDGTPENPYVIEGWEINASMANGIEIRNTDAHFAIRDVNIHSGGSSNDGIALSRVINGQVTDSTVSGNRWGIFLQAPPLVSSNVRIARNIVSNNTFGIWVDGASETNISENEVSSNKGGGILVWSSANVTLRGNSLSGDNSSGIAVFNSKDSIVMGNVFTSSGLSLGGRVADFFRSHTIATDNLVNGKPIRYYRDCEGLEVDDIPVGQLIVASCTNVRVESLEIMDTDTGIQLAFVEDARIHGNSLSDNVLGAHMTFASEISFSDNDVKGNSMGVHVGEFTEGVFHHNNFIDNGRHVFDESLREHSWDNGYPVGGNYWSDYVGEDECSGPDQLTCPDPDAIGDTAYEVDFLNQDLYPLMEPSSMNNTPPRALFTVSLSTTGTVTTASVNASTSSDLEDPVSRLEVRWDWEDDGIWDTPWTLEKTTLHNFTRPGTHTIRLEVRDTAGWTNGTVQEVTVPDFVAPTIQHAPPDGVWVGQGIPITVTVVDLGSVAEVLLFYRRIRDADFARVVMSSIGGDTYQADIPPQAQAGELEYYVVASDQAGNVARSPASGVYEVRVQGSDLGSVLLLWAIIVSWIVAAAATAIYLVSRGQEPRRPH